MARKFKPGDKVRFIPGITGYDPDKIYHVGTVFRNDSVTLVESSFPARAYSIYDLRPAPKYAITITTDTETATACYIEDGVAMKKVTLARDKRDQHDMKKLAAYAVQRLFPHDGNLIITVGSGYTGAVCVINSQTENAVNGRILEFVSGKCTNTPASFYKWHIPLRFDTFEEVVRFAKKNHFGVVELHRR